MKRQIIQSWLTTSLITGTLLILALLLTARFTGRGAHADEPKSPAPADAAKKHEHSTSSPGETASQPTQAELEQKFQDTLSGSTFQGHFTNNRDPNGISPKEDKYTIDSVKKLQGDIWLFTARIQYEKHDVSLPLPLRVVWAGDTPVITLDKMPVPGMGSFTARVMIFDNQYAGMWDGGDHGGLLFGKIVKEAPKSN
jgi:hypothetical protein